MLYAAKSDIGMVRSMNQDQYVIVEDLPVGQLYLVADGMGGQSAGDVASRLATEEISNYLREHLRPEIDAEETFLASIHHANQVIYESAEKHPDYQGMGTTVVAALTHGSQLYFVNIGDSRAYFYTAGQLRQVTDDHSLVAELLRRGQLTETEAKVHPQRNIVTRSLGTEPQSRPDIYHLTWSPGDVFLLCSDGLTNFVKDAELAEFLRRAEQCNRKDLLVGIVDEMIQLALDRGGLDNVTAIVVVHREERDAD